MSADLPPEAWAAALSGLPLMGPSRLRTLLRTWPPPIAWKHVTARTWVRNPACAKVGGGSVVAIANEWSQAAARVDVAAVWRAHVEAEVGVAAFGSRAFPAALASDVEPPAVLFTRGDPTAIAGPRVAIVGTRAATRYGLDVAYELGRDLASAGVAIVSGLAIGIDAAAHSGALAADTAPPIGVVGCGLDVVYPRRNAALWREVERRGVLLGEAPLGARPERWRFPARNRIIAALADVVVVVESGATGGSMHTVTEAERRNRPVFAAPGSVRSKASSGTNRLLSEGAQVACDGGDILVALGLSAALARPVSDRRPAPSVDDTKILDAIGWSPASLDGLAARLATPLGPLALALHRLCQQGWLVERAGWFERVARSEP